MRIGARGEGRGRRRRNRAPHSRVCGTVNVARYSAGKPVLCPASNIHFVASARIVLLVFNCASVAFLFSGRGECRFFAASSLPRRMFLCCCIFLREAVPSVFCPACFVASFFSCYSRTLVFESLVPVLFELRRTIGLWSSGLLPVVPRTSSRPSPALCFVLHHGFFDFRLTFFFSAN